MKVTLNIVGALLVLFGTIWFLQGINILPGSFMTGKLRWAVYGGIAIVAGLVVIRGKSPAEPQSLGDSAGLSLCRLKSLPRLNGLV